MEPPRSHNLATYTRVKLLLTGTVYLPLGILALGVAFGLLPWFVAQQVKTNHGSWGLLILAAVPLFWAWFLIPYSIRRLKESAEKNCWLRADDEALSLRLPGNSLPPLHLSYEMWEYRFLWKEVESVELFGYSVNAIARSPNLLLRARGGTLLIESIYFKESTEEIRTRIERARPK